MPPKTAKKSAASKADAVQIKVDAPEENEDVGCHHTDHRAPRGTPAPQKLPQITVARLLNETQLGVSMHKRITQQMTRLRTENPEKFLRDTCQCLLHVLLVYKVRPSSFTSFTWGGSFLLSAGFSLLVQRDFSNNFQFFCIFLSPLFTLLSEGVSNNVV